MRELSNIEFACDADASAAANRLSKQLKYHNLTQISSRQTTAKPATNSTISHDKSTSSLIFKVEAKLELDASVVARITKASGRFILATNVLDASQLNPDQMIVKYKEQQAAERVWVSERLTIISDNSLLPPQSAYVPVGGAECGFEE